MQFQANSSHKWCVELALKGVLCTCLGRKGPLNARAPNKGEQLFMAAMTLVIRLCACVRYWLGRGLVYGTRVKLALTFVSVRVKPEQKTYFPLELAHLVGKVLDWSVVHFLQVVTVGDNMNKANKLKSKLLTHSFAHRLF